MCPDVGGQSQVQEQSTNKGVMMDESFQLPEFKPPVSGKPLRALESVTLKKPRKAELCPPLTCICCLSGTARCVQGCVQLVGDSSQGRGRRSSPSLPCAAPLASRCWGEPWLQGSSSLTPAHPMHPPCLHWADSYYSCLRYLKREGSNPIF